MTGAETAQYVQHRLEVAGLARPLPFDRRALQRIHELARGVPRRVNLLCDRALLGAFADGQPVANRRTVEKAAVEVFGDPPRSAAPGPRALMVLGLGLAVGAGLYAVASRWLEPAAPQPLAAQSASSPSGASVVTPAAAPVAASVSAAPVAAAEAVPPTLLREADQAWRELAQVWKLPLPEQGDPCGALQKDGVQCFNRSLSLPLIRELGRPGILTLDAATGSPRYALLTGLTRDSATLQAGGTEQTVTLTALAQRWQGGFATLWRSPPGYRGRSDDAETLAWLAQGLAKATGAPAPSGPVSLDAELRSRLRTFQTAQGLAADGQPGPMTFMQLNRAAGVDEPRLRSGS